MHGGCPEGADAFAAAWVEHCKTRPDPALAAVEQDPHPADWDHCVPGCPGSADHRKVKKPGDVLHPGELDDYCPGAGPRRNTAMVALAASRAVAAALVYRYGLSSGTSGTLRELDRAWIHYTLRQAWPPRKRDGLRPGP